MHIAFVINNYLPHVGGVELHVHALARALAQRDHKVTVLALSEFPGDTKEDGLRVIRYRERLRIGDVFAFPAPGTSRMIQRFLCAEDVHLVSVHTRFFPMTWLGILASRRAGIPAVLTEHGADYVKAGSMPVTLAARVVDETAGRWVLRRADAVLGVSEDVTRFTQKLGSVSGRVFYNGIDLPDESTEQPIRAQHLVFVGRLVAGKGWRTFIDAVIELRRRGIAVTGSIVGGGPDAELVREAAPAYVNVMGQLAPGAVATELQGAILVNPSVLPEGFQLTVLEAIAAGGRVVSYPVPSARALFADAAPITLTEPNLDALIEGLVARIKDPGEAYPRERLTQWSWAARAAQFERIALELYGCTPDAMPSYLRTEGWM